MKDTTATTPPFIYIEKVENLNIDKLELATTSYIYIEKVENLHIGKGGLNTATSPSYHQQPSAPPETSTIPTLNHSQVVLAVYYVLISWASTPEFKTYKTV